MDSHYPLSAKRLLALIGDRMIDLPPCFIQRLERRLEAFEMARVNAHHVKHLLLVWDSRSEMQLNACGCPSEPEPPADVAVSVHTLQVLASIFYVLHSVHAAQQDVHGDDGLGQLLVEDLIVSGRELVRASADAVRSQP